MEHPVGDTERRIRAVEADRDHGASYLAAEAVRVLAEAALTGPTGDGWAAGLADVAARLAGAKPTMAGIRNATELLLGRLVEAGPESGRRTARRLRDSLLADLDAASAAAAAHAARQVPAGGSVLSCCYSSAVVRTLARARDDGRSPGVLVYEPATDGYGHRLAREVAGLGLPVRVFEDIGEGDVLAGAGLCLTGADAVTPGGVLNGTPSLALARGSEGMARYLVVCESLKFATEARADEGYDRVPLALVAAIATEDGVYAPEQALERALPR